LVIHCNKPFLHLAHFLSDLEGSDSLIVPKDYYEKVGKDEFMEHPVGSGSYQVSQYGSIPGTADTAPAPPFEDGDDLGVLGDFNYLDPNGTWDLYAYDDANGDDGFLSNGWSLTFETQPIPEPTAAVLFAVGTFVVGGTLRRRRA
jgi:hypothetical protein